MPRFPKGSPEAKAHMAKIREARAAKSPRPSEEQIIEDDKLTLERRVQELEQLLKANLAQPKESPQEQPQVQVGAAGLVGTFEKYKVDPKYYPNPVERLSKEPKLQQFAFPVNYELDYKVETTSYETIDGIRMKEPRFTLELRRVVRDDDGNATTGRYVLRRATFHEDPEAALVIAEEQGLPVDESNQKGFLDEMRYLRMRDVLLEWFFPPKQDVKKNKKEMIVGNRLVEYYEVSSTSSQAIPFSDLTGKV